MADLTDSGRIVLGCTVWLGQQVLTTGRGRVLVGEVQDQYQPAVRGRERQRFFYRHALLTQPLRQQRDCNALPDALSEHTPADKHTKALPLAEAKRGATGL